MTNPPKKFILGISGASGAILGIRMLEALNSLNIETHLIITKAAEHTILEETSLKAEDVITLAHEHHAINNIGSALASGSFKAIGMAIVPCSIKSLSAIANAYTADLLSRAADVTLKEGRPLLLAVRETPLHSGHLRLMQLASEAGAIIFPPIPAFYTHPNSLDELVNNTVGRMLARIGIENDLYQIWDPEKGNQEHTK